MKNLNKKQKIIIAIIIVTIFGIYSIYKEKQKERSNLNELLEINKTKENQISETKENTENNKIIIHISGEIKTEGVYELEEGSRIIDAINKAGGTTETADTSQINLAEKIEDGMKIYIPKKGEEITEIDKQTVETQNSNENIIQKKESQKININTATEQELDTLPGIGEATAKKIIEYRKENGKFSKIEEIKEVKGIGESKFQKIKNLIEI